MLVLHGGVKLLSWFIVLSAWTACFGCVAFFQGPSLDGAARAAVADRSISGGSSAVGSARPHNGVNEQKITAMGGLDHFTPAARPEHLTAATVPDTVYVVKMVDSTADQSMCSLAPSAPLATCNLRSALALCMARFKSLQPTCPSKANAVALGCTVVLPVNSTSVIQGRLYGTVVNVASLAQASWGSSTCKYITITLTITGGSRSRAAVVGDRSAASLVLAQNAVTPNLVFSMANVTVSNFGNNASSSSAGAVVLTNVLSAAFSRVSFRGNVGYETGGEAGRDQGRAPP